jgi:hypothetical protein
MLICFSSAEGSRRRRPLAQRRTHLRQIRQEGAAAVAACVERGHAQLFRVGLLLDKFQRSGDHLIIDAMCPICG